MKKLLVMSMLALAAYGFAQDSQSAQPGQTTAGQATGAQPQQKTIKDPAEYNAYMSAISSTDPNAKAQALEAFLQQYPNTVVKEETLEQLMAAYQAAQNQAKMADAANRLLQVNPNNIRALALLTYGARAQGNFSQAASFAQRGLPAAESMPRPQGTSDADYKNALRTWQAVKIQTELTLSILRCRFQYFNRLTDTWSSTLQPVDN